MLLSDFGERAAFGAAIRTIGAEGLLVFNYQITKLPNYQISHCNLCALRGESFILASYVHTG